MRFERILLHKFLQGVDLTHISPLKYIITHFGLSQLVHGTDNHSQLGNNAHQHNMLHHNVEAARRCQSAKAQNSRYLEGADAVDIFMTVDCKSHGDACFFMIEKPSEDGV